MGYEVKYSYHPKVEGSYDTDTKEEKTVKVGKPFDDTPLDKCAAAILAQLARRDIWVVDVEVCELVKKEISFKESADGKGIVLKNKRFSLNATAQMVEEAEEVIPNPQPAVAPQPVQTSPTAHPHEQLQLPPTQVEQSTDELYANSGAASIRRSVDPRSIDRNKKLYHVYFDPDPYREQARALKLKFSEDTRYAVHSVIPSPTGKIDQQQLALTDDSGQIVILDEKFFTTAGAGLLGDDVLDFSGKQNLKREKRPKLAFENEMRGDVPELPEGVADIPLDTGEVPADLMQVPDLRSK